MSADTATTNVAHRTYRDLVKHSGIYSLSVIITRLASVVLLPVYTRYLSPTDYGYIAILDLTSSVVGTLVGSGIASAVNRYRFEATTDADQDAVWWTGLTFLLGVATIAIGLVWLVRTPIAHLTLGADYADGSRFYTLVFMTLWCGIIAELPNTYLRVRRWSALFVAVAVGALLLNVGLNLYFLVALHYGVRGMLLGNLITGLVRVSLLLGIFVYFRGPFVIRWPLVRELWRFGAPIAITSLLSLAMHQADRYLLRGLLTVERVGIYSFAYTIGQAINAVCLMPFVAIWSVELYEIGRLPDAKRVYVSIFKYFVYGLALVMLGVSVFARPALAALAAPAYLEAADLIPIVCLAYMFFSIHEHFKVPALLSKKTASMVPGYLVAALTNVGVNLVAIPRFGIVAAAWTSVLTFATFSFIGLWRYRRIDKYPYPFARCASIVGGMAVTVAVERQLATHLSGRWALAFAGIVWSLWAAALIGPLAVRYWRDRKGAPVAKVVLGVAPAIDD